MALTVRLSPRAERLLKTLAKRRQLSRSDIVREALARYDMSDGAGGGDARPYDAWLDVVGVVNLGVRDAKRTTGEQFAAVLQREHGARRTR